MAIPQSDVHPGIVPSVRHLVSSAGRRYTQVPTTRSMPATIRSAQKITLSAVSGPMMINPKPMNTSSPAATQEVAT